MNKYKKQALIAFCMTALFFASSCQSSFDKLGIGKAENLRSDINKFLQKSYAFRLPELVESEKSDSYISQFQSTTDNGITLTITKAANKREIVTIEMPIGKKGNEKSVQEFLGLMASIINRFSGFDFIEPIGEALIQQGVSDGSTYRSEHKEDKVVYGFTINLDDGYCFAVMSI